jgi:stress-induced morphogen
MPAVQRSISKKECDHTPRGGIQRPMLPRRHSFRYRGSSKLPPFSTNEVSMEPADIVRKIEDALGEAEVHVTDLTGTRDHYSVVVVSPAFEGKLVLKQHRLVNAALADELASGELHALQLKTMTPAEWEASQE